MMIILFKVATFMILVVIIVYGYAHYARPVLQRILDDFRDAYAYMLKTNSALDKQQQEIAEHARRAQETAHTFMQKIVIWKDCVREDQEQRIRDVEQLRTQVAQLRHERQENSVAKQVRMRLIMHALHAAQQELTQQYQQPSEAEKYIDTLVQTLRNQE
jgi:hypothetical protein